MNDLEPSRSASETVIKVLEEFGNSEPKYLICIWVDESDDVCISRTQITNVTMQLGLIESAKMMIGGYLGGTKDSN